VTSVASAAAWLAATSSLGAISSTAGGANRSSGRLAMMVESDSSGSERPKMLMAPLSLKGRPIWPTPQASESSGTSW
jgi:hypothetical protein